MLLQMTEIIDLYHNNLSGEITHYIDGWLDARNIDLSFNNFSGVLPDSLGVRLAALKSIDLSSNNFTGSIPKSLYNLSTLTFLNISNNNFEGNLSCSGTFRKLSSLSFHHNPLLCGKYFNLKCRNKAKQNHSSAVSKKMKITIITIAAAIVGVLSATIVLYLRLTKKSSRNARASFKAGNQFMVVADEAFVRATGNFSPNNLLGQGNQGFVYAGVLGEGDLVAIKVFSRETQQIAEKGSFMKECQTLGMIRHRNLIKIITVCCTENIKAIIMPLMPKGSLHSLLHEKASYGRLAAISLQSRFQILKEIVSGLSYLHHHCTPPIVHCDIKPENVLLDYDFTAKLSDFGIVKVLRNSDITVSSILKGSIGYIAPEFGEGGEVSVKGDIYSFGIVLLTRMKPTDPMFSSDMSLCNWVAMALEAPENNMQFKETMNFNGGLDIEEEEWIKVEKIMKLGVFCCSNLPKERPTMQQVEGILATLCDDAKNEERIGPGKLDSLLADSLHTIQKISGTREDSSTFSWSA